MSQSRQVTQPDSKDVSVVIATRDRPELLRRAIDAVLTQDHPGALEIVVVYDRSDPDRTLSKTSTENGLSRNVVITTNSHTPGLAGARNSGVLEASHPWIAFCDDDDEWLPGKLAAQFGALVRNPEALMAVTGVFINYEGKDTARIPDPAKLTFEGFLTDRMTEVHPSTFLLATDALTGPIGPVDETLPGGYAEDYDLLLRASQVTSIAVAELPLTRIYWHGASFFFERWKTIDEALQFLTDKHPGFDDHPVGLARIRGQQAVAQAAMKERRRSVGTAFQAFRLNWKELRVPVALILAVGVSPSFVLKTLHRFGKGI